MPCSGRIDRFHQRGGSQRLAVNGNRIAILERDPQGLGLVRSLLRLRGPAPHASRWGDVRVFQHASLVGDVQQIGVHRVGAAAVWILLHFDAVLLGVRKQVGPGTEIPFPPRGDDRKIRV